ncbi:hypothetical protein D3C71_1677220 [compost metagenome]
MQIHNIDIVFTFKEDIELIIKYFDLTRVGTNEHLLYISHICLTDSDKLISACHNSIDIRRIIRSSPIRNRLIASNGISICR